MAGLLEKYKTLNISKNSKNLSFEEVASGLKDKTYKKICMVTGAGISVASGIPDFRSEGGLYQNLAKKYGKSNPEELMTLNFFKETPEMLYSVMREFLKNEVSIS